MTSQQRALVEHLVGELFEPEVRRHNKLVDALIEENDQLLGRQTVGINYLGQNYGRGGYIVTGGAILSPSLMPEMNRLVRFKKSVDFDRQHISQVLSRLIEPTKLGQDQRDALPECLVSFAPWLLSLPRTREPAYTIQDSPRDLRQYLKALSKIETYYAMRFLY